MIDVEVLTAPGVFSGSGMRSPARGEVVRLCTLAANAAGVSEAHLAVEFVAERRISELNGQYRGRPAATDVLSFPIDGAGPLAGERPAHPDADLPMRELGDVVICPSHTADIREAIVHGVLHLLGFDHEHDNGEMLALQRALLAQEPQ